MVTLRNCMLALQLAVIQLVVAEGDDTVFTVRKCCPNGSVLLDVFKIKCITPSSIKPTTQEEYDWIPRPLEDIDGEMALLSIPDVKVEYGLGPECDISDRKFMKTLYSNKKEQPFKLFAHNGSLVEIKRFNNKTSRVGFFTDKSFCVDRVSGEEYTHAAKICMCVEKKCLQKCCSYGKLLNTEKNICLPNMQTLPNYSPVIYGSDLLPLVDPPNDLYFLEALPRCQPRGFDVLNGVDPMVASAFYIQEDGNVVLVDGKTKRTVDRTGYCFDMVQQDEETIGPNLAVCQKTSDLWKNNKQGSEEEIYGESSRGSNSLYELSMVTTLSSCTLFRMKLTSSNLGDIL